jgi:hypothetical protein
MVESVLTGDISSHTHSQYLESTDLDGYATESFVTSQGYLTSYTETDPIFVASAAYDITGTNINNWNLAYGWGDHSTEGYLTDITKSMVEAVLTGDISTHTHSQYLTSYTETDPIFSAWDKSTGITITESQITDLQSYLTSESDPIFDAHVASGIVAGDITNWNTAYG